MLFSLIRTTKSSNRNAALVGTLGELTKACSVALSHVLADCSVNSAVARSNGKELQLE